ncbi:E3 ubiquitin-protein ligase RBBP6-like [Phaenicophaeus curvirostris]|uniref:E3 ubiquitin-protein ligase RBBP6-like n=1 Tax=Phaenicophaeus curvirostris TaxID=33595 RepID=UPI0037F0AF77
MEKRHHLHHSHNLTLCLIFLTQVYDSLAPMALAKLIKTANLAGADASEEDKIKAMMIQSCQDCDPINYVKTPLSSNTWFHCGKPGHSIRNGPDDGGRHPGSVPRMKKCTGIPRSFLMEVEDPNTKGAMLTNTGKYVIPILNAEAYAREKKKKPPLLPVEPSSTSSDPVPEEQPPLTPPPPALVAFRPPAALLIPSKAGEGAQQVEEQAGNRPTCFNRETKMSKLDKFTNEFREEPMEYEKIPKAWKH